MKDAGWSGAAPTITVKVSLQNCCAILRPYFKTKLELNSKKVELE